VGSSAQARRRNTILAGVEQFRLIDPRVTVTNIVTFLYVCENEGLSITELAGVAGLSTATASRAVRALAPPGAQWTLAPHLDLVNILAHGPQRNSKTLVLTARGRELRAKLNEIISGAVSTDG
jgi:DNA-binding MarR family transcriptional regulator